MHDAPALAEERVPTREELSKIIRMATPRGRVAIAMMAFGGLRPESLGDYRGTDGVRLGDFSELRIYKAKAEFGKPPCMVTIGSNLGKGRHRYFSLVGSESITPGGTPAQSSSATEPDHTSSRGSTRPSTLTAYRHGITCTTHSWRTLRDGSQSTTSAPYPRRSTPWRQGGSHGS